MYFKLNSSSYLVTGKNGGTIYDLVSSKMIQVPVEYVKELAELDGGKEVEQTSLPQAYMNTLLKAEVANFYEKNVCVEKIRIGLPRNIKSFSSKRIRVFNLYVQMQDTCNLNCIHCNKSGVSHRSTGCRKYEKRIEIREIDSYVEVMEASHNLGCNTLHIVGGEPLLNQMVLEKIIQEAIRIGYHNIYIYTNGLLLTDDFILKYAHNVKFVLHLVAHTQILLEQIDSSGSLISDFEAVISSLRRYGATFYFNICLNEKSAEFKEEIRSYAASFQAAGYIYGFTYMELDDECYYNQICSAFLDENKVIHENSFFNNLEHHPCMYGKITVFADGSVGVCPMMPYEMIGSIKEDKLSQILAKKKQDAYWNLTLDQIETCSSCSKRYGCSDCRAVKDGIVDQDKKIFCCQ